MKKKVNVIMILSILFTGSLFAENLLVNPSFENQTPAFWNEYNGVLNNELRWEQTEVYGGFYSFKVTKSGATSNAVGWKSVNNADLYWNNAAAATYSLSAYVKTVGVNTSPATDDAKIGVIFEFKNAAGAELTTQTVWADQSSGSVDWTQIQGVAILSEEPASVVVKAIMGKDATGTVYFDNISCGSDPWSMGLFNGNAETIDGWLNWYSSTNGSYGTVTNNESHFGNYASELYKPDTTSSTSEIVYYSIPQPVEAGEWYKIGVWVKTEDVNDSSAFDPTYILRERIDERIALCYFFHAGNIGTEWTLAGGDKFVYIDQRDPATGWTHYVVAEQAPDDATGISVRARFTSNPTGTAWFDDFSVEKIIDGGDQLIANASFESQEPAFWNGYNGALNNELSWEQTEVYGGFHSFKVSKSADPHATNLIVNPGFEDQTPAFWSGLNGTVGTELGWEQTDVYGGFYSFKVTKSGATSSAVGWLSDDNADLFWNNAAAATYSLSAYVKTVGVNTSPATDDAKIGVIFEFKNAAGAELTTQTVWADQSSGSVDWAQIQGVAILSEEPASVVVKAIMGKDATGTVYFDNISCGSDPWSMGLFNGNAETIKGWLNWYSSSNGSYGTVTDNEAHSGSYTSELFKPDTTSSTSEIVYYSVPQPVEAGEWYKIGVWVKTSDVNDSSAFDPTYILRERIDERIALCYFFHAGNIGTEWTLAGGDKFVYIDQRDPATGWTHYVVAEQAPDDATGISVRARFTSNPTGTAWFDDFSVEKIINGGDQLIANASFESQEPAFWNGYNAMLNNELLWEQTEVYGGFYSFKVTKGEATSNAVGWVSDNNADLFWNNASAATYSLSAYVKTVDVNISPATDDAKIGVIFEFKNAAGAELTTQTVWADQSSGSVDWTQIQGVAILSEEPASVVVKAIMGKDATGTVYFDNISCGSDPWSMGLFNGNAETIDGWLNWYSSTNGSYGTVSDNEANTGSYASELYKPDTTSSTSEIVYYSVPQPVEAGEWYKIGVWVKTSDVNDSSAFDPTYILRERIDERIALCYFFHAGNIGTEWTLADGDKFVYIDQRDPATGWTHYVVAEQAPDDATGISVRARFTSNPTGTAWFDDFSVEKMVVAPVAPARNDVAVGWISDNNADLYWNNAAAATYSLSAYVKTVGVNTSPATDDAKIGVIFEFKNAAGAELTTQTVWADQSSGSVDWAQIQGVAILSEEPASVVVKAIMGKDAAGTVYFDNISCGSDPWSMGLFNGNAETIKGWLNWYSSTNGSYGTVTDNEAHSGSYTSELFKPDTTSSTSEIVYYSIPQPVEAGEWYKIGVWVKTSDVNDSSAFDPTYILRERIDERIALCYFFHAGNIGTEWTLADGDKFVYIDQRDPATGWTHYVVAEQAPDDATGISVRARFTSNPTGTAWFDDFSAIKMVVATPTTVSVDDENESYQIPTDFELSQNYPNPFNPVTSIEFAVPHDEWINLSIYNLLGQKVNTLINGVHTQGRYHINWNAQNEFGQPVASGVYIYTLLTKDTRITKKMLLVR